MNTAVCSVSQRSDPAAPHARLGYGQLQLVRGDHQLVAGFCWFVCLGFRKPAHLGQANLPAQNTRWPRLQRNRQNWICWSEMGWNGKKLSVGSHQEPAPRAGAAQGAGWHPPDRSLSEPTSALGHQLRWSPGTGVAVQGGIKGF